MTLDLDGRTIETAWWGKPPDQAPTLVLLHEGLGCVALWRGFPERLAAATGCGVFAYSRFGYGQSAPVPLPRPLTYMHGEAEHVLPRILDAAGIRRAVLVGHSDGASIATLYAGSRQDFRIAGLVLIAPHFFVEDISIASIEAARIAYRDTDLHARLGRYHADPDNAFRGWNDAWLDPAFRSWRIDEPIPLIRVPVLLVQGADDEYGTLAQLDLMRSEAYCPVETLVIEGARHSPHLDAGEQVVAAISSFVRRLDLQHNA